MEDQPKTLSIEQVRAERMGMLHQTHIRPLTEFVERVRSETGLGKEIPYFDPLDGGVNARCFFLFEAPGPKAVRSGFVSRNNPDDSARNFFELNREAGIPRNLTVSWNIVPWYIGSGTKIRPATDEDIRAGKKYLIELLPLLPHLKVVVLGGNKAKKAEDLIVTNFPNVTIVSMMHTSPLVVNTNKENRTKILEKLRYVAFLLSKG